MSERDPFEQHLSSQPMREIPGAWRAEILAAVQSAGPSHPVSRVAHPVPRWRELFWPHPTAWAALAGVWLFMFGAHLAVREETPVRFAQQSPPSPQMRELLKEQIQLFAELTEPKAHRDADRPKSVAPQPHSSRRGDFANA